MRADDAVVEIFRAETAERLDELVETLLAIEAGTGPDDAVDALFRHAHSIKGNAGMVGFEDLRRMAHAMEDVLDEARRSEGLPAAHVDPLLRATDAMRRALAGRAAVADEVVSELEALLEHEHQQQQSVASARPAPVAPPAPAAPTPDSAAPPAADGPAEGDEEPALGEHEPVPPEAQRTLRVAASKVDRMMDVVGETVLHHRRLDHVLSGGREVVSGERVEEEIDAGELLLDELQDAVLQMRTLPLSTITGPFPRAVRDLAHSQGKQVELVIEGAETQLDRVILDGLSEILVHVLRNAVSHGIESPAERQSAGKPATGRVVLRAGPREGRVSIEISDDGRGVPAEVVAEAERRGSLVDLLAEPGYTTAERVDETSGRGVGLDAVKRHVESLSGELAVRSEPGRGTTFTLRLPLTLALLHILVVERGGHSFGFPLASVQEGVPVDSTLSLVGRPSLEVHGESVPAGDLATLLGLETSALAERSSAVVLGAAGQRVALLCDALVGEEEVVVKTLGPLLAAVPGYLGAAIRGDGGIALIVDPAHVARTLARGTVSTAPEVRVAPRASVLVVDDQFTVRELQRSILEAAGFQVVTAKDGREALAVLRTDDTLELVVTDVEMPTMDGIELVEAIRADPARAALPVVIVSARKTEQDRRRGVEAGADAYIVKDEFDQRTLLETVRRLIGS